MNPMVVGMLFSGVWLLFAVPAAICLVLAYTKTRMSGFLWLCGSVVAWPLLERSLTLIVSMSIPSFAASRGLPESSIVHALTALSLVESTFGGLLLLGSCYILYRQVAGRLQPASNSAIPAVYAPEYEMGTPPGPTL